MDKINDTLIKNKIIQIEIAGRGGICHYTYNLAFALSELKNVILITGKNYELSHLQHNFEIIEIFNRFKTNPFFLFQLFKIFQRRDVSIIHFQLSQHPAFILFLCYFAKMFTNKKIFVTSHNLESHEELRIEKAIYNKIFTIADKIIVHANVNKLEMEKKHLVNAFKISVIPHGNYSFFNNALNYIPHFKKSFNVLFFGFIRKYKGLSVLLHAMKLIKNKIPEVKLYIIGKEVECFSKYKYEIEKLDLTNNIEINLSYIQFDKVKNYFLDANIVVLPYLKICQSGILQLAYGFGRPVIVTNVGGLPESVDNGSSGYIVPPGDPEALAARIIELLINETLQKEMGQYALNLSQTKFSWQQIALKTLGLYNSTLI